MFKEILLCFLTSEISDLGNVMELGKRCGKDGGDGTQWPVTRGIKFLITFSGGHLSGTCCVLACTHAVFSLYV